MLIGALIAILFAGGTSCGTGGTGVQDEGAAQSNKPSASQSTQDETDTVKHVKLVLSSTVCQLHGPNNMLYVDSVSGAPAGGHRTEAQYRPFGAEQWVLYSRSKYDVPGYSDVPNDLSEWEWSCIATNKTAVPDKPGEYRIRISWPDTTNPHAQTDWVRFAVK